MTLADTAANDTATDRESTARAESAITIYVCITCRGGADYEPVPTPGAVLAAATMRAAAGTGS